MNRVSEFRKRRLLLLTAASSAAFFQAVEGDKPTKQKRKYWVRPFLKDRKLRGDFFVAIPEMIKDDPSYYFETFRMTPELFEDLLRRVGPSLQKDETLLREPVSASERLHLTLSYLVSGDQQKSVAKNFRLGRSTVCDIIHATTAVIFKILAPLYLKAPTMEDWKRIAFEYFMLWNYPNCVGAIDGKHFAIPAPPDSGSVYFNYKGFFSIVLLATCDANYNFTTMSIGSAGSESDSGIFSRSTLGKMMRNHSIPFPEPHNIPDTPVKFPYVMVGDEAFPLMDNLMRPYPRAALDKEKRIFNYRLSRARRVIENTFGILICRWRLLYDTIQMKPEYATDCIKSCIALHNYVRNSPLSSSMYTPRGMVDYEDPNTGVVTPGAWRSIISNETVPLQQQSSNNYTLVAAEVRDNFKLYFNGVGSVPWQDERAMHS